MSVPAERAGQIKGRVVYPPLPLSDIISPKTCRGSNQVKKEEIPPSHLLPPPPLLSSPLRLEYFLWQLHPTGLPAQSPLEDLSLYCLTAAVQCIVKRCSFKRFWFTYRPRITCRPRASPILRTQSPHRGTTYLQSQKGSFRISYLEIASSSYVPELTKRL